VIDPATRHAQPDGWYGLGGVSFTGKPGAWSKIALRDPGQTRLVLHYVGQPGSGKVRITAGDVHIATLDTSMPQKTAAHETWRIPAEAQEFEIEIEDAPVRLFCVEFLKDSDGVIYSSLGLNGTWAGVLAWYMNGPHWSDQLKEARPDLVVLNYGTNESGFPKYVDSTYVKDVREIVRRIRTALPATPILVMSPMDRGVRESGGTIGTISALPRLVQKQAQVATETGCAFFNTFEAMGGSGTMGRWYQAEPRMVSADFIHRCRPAQESSARSCIRPSTTVTTTGRCNNCARPASRRPALLRPARSPKKGAPGEAAFPYAPAVAADPGAGRVRPAAVARRGTDDGPGQEEVFQGVAQKKKKKHRVPKPPPATPAQRAEASHSVQEHAGDTMDLGIQNPAALVPFSSGSTAASRPARARPCASCSLGIRIPLPTIGRAPFAPSSKPSSATAALDSRMPDTPLRAIGDSTPRARSRAVGAPKGC